MGAEGGCEGLGAVFPHRGWVGDGVGIKAVGGHMGVQLWGTEGDLR